MVFTAAMNDTLMPRKASHHSYSGSFGLLAVGLEDSTSVFSDDELKKEANVFVAFEAEDDIEGGGPFENMPLEEVG